MAKDLPSATVNIYWNSRRKAWDLHIRGRVGDTPRSWTWLLRADSTAPLDEGMGYLILKAVQETMEAVLI